MQTIMNAIGGRARALDQPAHARRVQSGDGRAVGHPAPLHQGRTRRRGGRRQACLAGLGPTCRHSAARVTCSASSNSSTRNTDKIASAISAEHGKTHADAVGEVQRGIEVVDFACGIPHLLKGEFSRHVGPAIDTHSDRQPLGVCAGHHAVQLPGDGADVDVPGRHRLREHLRAEALRARSERRHGGLRPVQAGRASPMASSTSSMATRRWSTPSSATPTSRR